MIWPKHKQTYLMIILWTAYANALEYINQENFEGKFFTASEGNNETLPKNGSMRCT